MEQILETPKVLTTLMERKYGNVRKYNTCSSDDCKTFGFSSRFRCFKIFQFFQWGIRGPGTTHAHGFAIEKSGKL